MLAVNVPAYFPLAWAQNAGAGFIRSIPITSQIGITPGAASLPDGYVPLNMTPVSAGGVPPFGQDTNGILYQITSNTQWSQAGGQPTYNAAFSTAIGGYPNGAVLQSLDLTGYWRSTVDNNTSDPDTGGANWLPINTYGATTISGLTNANVTLSASQYAKTIIILTGTLTGNVQITFPALIEDWYVINSTTGAFTLSALVAAGTPVVLAQGGASILRGNGTNVVVDALQIGPATAATQSVQFSQISGVVGAMRNAKMYLAAASASATFSADEIIVETALGGLRYCLASYSKSINLATTGAGGMDTGTAPVSGFVALYAIYNPTTKTASILATNAATLQGNVYGGANMPTGYTASALIGVWPTNGISQLVAGLQMDRFIGFVSASAMSTSTSQASLTSLSISSIVPANAKSIGGIIGVANSTSASQNTALTIASDSVGNGAVYNDLALTSASGSGSVNPFSGLQLLTAQTMYYQATTSTGTPTYTINISSYSF